MMLEKIKNIVKSGNFLSLLGNVLAAAFNLFTFMLLARVFDESSLGNWLLFLTAVGFLDMLRAGIIRSALIKFSTGSDSEKAIGSAWSIGMLVTFVLVIIVFFVDLFFHETMVEHNWGLFTRWYPLLALANLPYYFSMWYQQAKYNFLALLVLRLVVVIPYFSFVLFKYFDVLEIEHLAIFYISIHLASSILAILLSWSGVKYLLRSTKNQIVKQLNFGKYSLGTVIGTNLLKSSDTFIIHAFMGPAFVAFYNVPYRFMEIIEVPVRSFGSTLFPKMAKFANENNLPKVARIFNGYTGFLTFMLIPVYIISFIFAEELVYILGGEKYVEYANIFRIFIVYGIMLPMDRYLGIALDSINLPKFNMIKIIAMVTFNVVVDIIVIQVFNDIHAVAIVTIGTVTVGVTLGMNYLKKKLPTNLTEVAKQGYSDVNRLVYKREIDSIYR